MDDWENFFLGQVGASAALGGLLFVAISLNLPQIGSAKDLADRALLALSLLLSILVVSSLMLIPDQPRLLIGIEVLAVSIAPIVLALTRRSRSSGRNEPGVAVKRLSNKTLLVSALAPYLAGGTLIVVGDLRIGLYFVAVAIVVSLIKAVLDAWVLLIEINR
jgi:hypothetical protein